MEPGETGDHILAVGDEAPAGEAGCGRTFAPDRVAKHQAICQKANSKKRPTFRSEKQRVYCEGGSGGAVVGRGRPQIPAGGGK